MLATLVMTACDESFTPIEPTELQFSVFGYLDAAADTQWIRISPIRPVVVTSPAPLGARVTLEHLGTGRIVEMRDSVFRFDEHTAGVGSGGVYLNNFWTTERIEPGATYRFSATRDGVKSSEAVVEVPPDYDVEVWLRQGFVTGGDLLRVEGSRHLVFVILSSSFYDQCGAKHERRFFPVERTDAEVRMIPISKELFPGGCPDPVVEKQELRVVGSGAPWPSGLEYGAGGLGVTDAPSNISNAVGFLGGVITKHIPYEECTVLISPQPPEYCRLRYDGTTATLSGTVWDTPCVRQGIASTMIRLTELDPDANGETRVRWTLSARSGAFSIGALEPGRRYALSANRFPLAHENPNDVIRYLEHTDTLQFEPGARVRYDIPLQRVEGC